MVKIERYVRDIVMSNRVVGSNNSGNLALSGSTADSLGIERQGNVILEEPFGINAFSTLLFRKEPNRMRCQGTDWGYDAQPH